MPTAVAIADKRTTVIARDLGWQSVLVDSQLTWDDIISADLPVEVNLEQWEQVAMKLEDLQSQTSLRAVVSTRQEYASLAAYLADLLDLQGLPLHAAQNCSSVTRTRLVLQASGIPTLRWSPALDPDDAARVARQIGFPVAVRTDLSAEAERACVCYDTSAVLRAAELLRQHTPPSSPILVVEEHLAGPLFITHAIEHDGQVEIVAVLEAVLNTAGRRAVIAARYPPQKPLQMLESITAAACASLMALDVANTVVTAYLHTAQDGVRFVAVEPGVPSEPFARLTESVTGIDLARAAVEVALQLPIDRQPARMGAGMLHYIWPEHGGSTSYPVREAQTAPEPDSDVFVGLNLRPGETVRLIPDRTGRSTGWILAVGDDSHRAFQHCIGALDRLAISPSAVSLMQTWAGSG